MLVRRYSLARATTSQGISLAIILVAVLALLQWQPPNWYRFLDLFRWYIMAGVAGYLFLLQRGRVDFSRARFYILFNILIWFGTLLSAFRTPALESVLYSAVSSTVPFFLGLMMLQALSTESGRKVWLYALFIAAFLWGYEIIRLWSVYGENIRHYLYGPGKDHNLISMNFALTSTVSLALALYANRQTQKEISPTIRVFAFIACVTFLVCTFLSYSRSGFIVACAGVFFVLFTLFLSQKTRGTFIFIFLLLMGAAWYMASIVQVTNPTWFIKFGEIVRLDDPNTSVYVRTVLLQKAWALLLENPIIGVGPGIFKTIYDPVIGHQSFYLVHNSYLTAWVEHGILGLLAYFAWIFLWIRFFLTHWNELDLLNRILTLIFIPFFLMLVFLDVGGFPLHFMLLIFSSLYGQNQSNSNYSSSEFKTVTKQPN